MTQSMTGYGNGKAVNDLLQVFVEIKSVNHRFFECVFRAPKQMISFESKIKSRIQNKLSRGRVEVFVTITSNQLTQKVVHVNWDIAQQLRAAAKEFDADVESLSFADLLTHEAVLSIEEIDTKKDLLEALLLAATDEAIHQLVSMRGQEGVHLEADLIRQQVLCTKHLGHVIALAPTVVQKYKDRLEQKLSAIGDENFDQNRLLTEIVLYTDKADIHEEATRLESHLLQLTQTLQENGPIGRKLDFLIQEMNREVNTIGAKSNEVLISREVVEMKTILEKMKEQVQNIE